MGFYISGDLEEKGFVYSKVNELRQHINLSHYAWQTISDDIRNFYLDETKESFSGFLNIIFANFHSSADATISQRYINKNDELYKIFSSNEFKSSNEDTKDLYISKMLEVYEKQLIDQASSYTKGIGKKFRINKENLDTLRESSESIYYDDSIGRYLKAVFEEYSLLDLQQRESIFFKDIIDTIKLGISSQNKLKLSILQKLNVKQEKYYSRKFYITPYKIVHDKNMSFNYLIGLAEEIYNNGNISKKHVSSFRLSRIDKISVMTSMSGFISKANKEGIDNSITEKGPQFMAGDLIDVKIILTKKGIESYNRQLYMRPNYYSKENNVYYFRCTEVQVMNYFFKFGRDAVIVEPIFLREKFIQRYHEASNHYMTAV